MSLQEKLESISNRGSEEPRRCPSDRLAPSWNTILSPKLTVSTSGFEDILERAESGTIEMTGENLEDVQKVYWSLSSLEASPADYRRLLDISMNASGN